VPWDIEHSVWPVRTRCECGQALPQEGWLLERTSMLEACVCPGCNKVSYQANLYPELYEDDYQTIAGSEELQVVYGARVRRNPWFFFVNFVVTEDSHWVRKGLRGPYHRFPPLEYLRTNTYTLWRYRFTAWPKARQMMLTWLTAAYMLGEAMFLGGRLYMIQSKKEEDSQAVLRRQAGIHDRMRRAAPWLVTELTEEAAGHLTFANGSRIVACPQGAHHVQSYTPAWLLADEAQLQDEMEQAYYQALPACEKITLVGSADFGWFWQEFLPDELGKEQ
jgi:hypothetical protein